MYQFFKNTSILPLAIGTATAKKKEYALKPREGIRAVAGELFNETELSVLAQIADRFKTTSTKEIIDISHREKAWIENVDQKKIIDYTYSFDLN